MSEVTVQDVDDSDDVDGDIDSGTLDPRRWLTLAIIISTVVLIAIDMSVLNVSIPTMLRDLDTTVPALQWVVTGYSLTFASLLIVGGRLGDIYGHRRMFIIGTSLFGLGSLLASEAPSVGVLIVGEAVIEGVGAALMTPATLAILSSTFRGRERAKAFAAWGAVSGAAVAFGPVLGGFLTTNYSWRWAFRINVVVAPLAVIGALLVMGRGVRQPRTPIDLPGAALISSTMFLVVFALSEGGAQGWFVPIDTFSIGGTEVWRDDWPVSIVTVALLLAAALAVVFVLLERSKERRGANPLFEFGQLRFRSFRYGLLTLLMLAMGQLALLFALPLFLQNAVHLTAAENGMWFLPMGIFIIVGSQVGGRLTRTITTTGVVRAGLVLEAIGLLGVVLVISPGIEFVEILPGMALFGTGVGFASSQLTNVILSEIDRAKSGVAGGAASTARQLGASFGAAVMGSIITVQTTTRAIAALPDAGVAGAVADQAAAGLRALGPNYTPGPGVSARDAAALQDIFVDALASASRTALIFAACVVALGAAVSFLIPTVRSESDPDLDDEEGIESFEAFDPLPRAGTKPA